MIPRTPLLRRLASLSGLTAAPRRGRRDPAELAPADVGAWQATETLEDRTLLAAFLVDSSADTVVAGDNMTTLREALLAAEANAEADTIAFAAGLGPITLTADLRGAGLTQTGGVSIIDAEGDVVIDGASLYSGLALTGGAAYRLEGLTFQNFAAVGAAGPGNSGNSGGALFVSGATVDVFDTTFTGNTANRAGGAIEVAGAGPSTLTLTRVTGTGNDTGVTGTASPGNGGFLHVTGGGTSQVFVNGGFFDGNLAAAEGGAFWNAADSTLTIGRDASDTDPAANFTTITGNVASGDDATQGGGGIFNDGGTVSVTGADISLNLADGAAGSGGGLFSVAGDVTLTDTFVELNSANRAGGGIEVVDGSVTLDGASSLFGNDVAGFAGGTPAPGNGGGLHVTGAANVLITGATQVSANEAAAEGGGLWNSSTGTLTITGGMTNGAFDVFIGNNFAAGAAADMGGGGIYNDGGIVNVAGAEITGNEATGAAGSGGGILSVGGTVDVMNALIAGNRAVRAGGGVELAMGADLTLNAVDFTDNAVAAAPGNGGAVHVTGGGGSTVSVTGGTFEGNTAANQGGALWNAGDAVMGVSGATFRNNVASGADGPGGPNGAGGGGAIYNLGALTVADSLLEANRADGALGSGGAILSATGTLGVVNSTINGNSAERAGGGVELGTGTATLRDVTLINNRTGDGGTGPGNGGGLHVTFDADTSIVGGRVGGNFAAAEGGGLWNSAEGTMNVRDVLVHLNDAAGAAADQGGGGIYNDGGDLTVTRGVVFRNNATGASGSGGGILTVGGALNVIGTGLSFNAANRAGGAIEVAAGMSGTGGTTGGGGADVVVRDASVRSNLAGPSGTAAPGNGGGLHVSGAGNDTSVTRGEFVGNGAAKQGGALWNAAGSTLTVTNAGVGFNVASGADATDGGGAIYNAGGDVAVFGGGFFRNAANGASGSGGGFFTNGGSLSVSGALLAGNIARRAGGGIEAANAASVSLRNSSLRSNAAGQPRPANPGNGGAVHVSGAGSDVSVVRGELLDNFAANEGGALWNANGSTLTVNGTGATRNRAGSTGGGIYAQPTARTVLIDAVFFNNTPNNFGGPGPITRA